MKPLVTTFRDLPAATLVNGVLTPSFVDAAYAGSFFYCKSSTGTFTMSLDAGQFFDWDGGYKITNTPFKKITFCNANLFTIRVYFSVSAESVDFVGTNKVKDQPTYLFGNCGLKANGVYNGQNVVIDTVTAPGFIKLTPASDPLTISGLNNGNTRRDVIFTCASATPDGNVLIVNDLNGCNALRVGTKQVIGFSTSDDFILTAINGAVYFNIGQFFYKA